MVQQKRIEFLSLFEEFVSGYLDTDTGRKHRAWADRVMAEGWKNYKLVLNARNDKEKMTRLVLEKLLPYDHTEYNRERGAWCHYAPVIKKDLHPYFEGAGFQTGEEWPQVAQAVLMFVHRAVENSTELDDACREFAALPYSKGFQAGPLSPILAAIDPERFCPLRRSSAR